MPRMSILSEDPETMAFIEGMLLTKDVAIVPDSYVDMNLLMGIDPKSPDALRGQGLTSHQMKTAPQKAVFVWRDAQLQYAIDLARHLEREDLEIRPPSWLDNPAVEFAYKGRSIVIDHDYYRRSTYIKKYGTRHDQA